MLNKIEVAKNSYCVGKIDDRDVPFHRLMLTKGTTYNAYLLDTDKATLIDTVDISFGMEFVKHLETIMDLQKLQYVVINHVEPDHAGAIGALMNKAKNAIIVTTELGKKFLIGMFKIKEDRFHIIRDGETLDIGGKTLQFFETPFLHTEETMVTYCIEDKILYPCDQFSTHIANYELFNDLAKEDITEDFKVYYKLIMHPHRPYVRAMIDKIKNLEINMICPSHGYVLRKDVQKYIDLYDELSQVELSTDKKALIVFSSMTGNTSKVAQGIKEGLVEMGVETNVVNIKSADLNTILDLAKEASAIIIGSSTKYGDMIGNIEDTIKEIIKLDLSEKLVTAFGSYGWSGEAIEIINDYLRNTNATLLDTSYMIKATGDDHIKLPLRVNFAPEEQMKAQCVDTGIAIGELLVK
ncbi:FprA family A-type flavoprotein [Clostridium swellfunianum]|uniref:FprA family A-type flavoprotein n=1 Tax=Clostridium swellfunianum TaxID=1367462 RepID=UPI00203083B8|nr:FprA family A-type flavoprotein [Clostridium swellfunianum]MCM0648239.1 FprA family A-type flavoprotein [Clostridium swellfunianum]